MRFRGIPRLYRRAVLIYLGAIVAPVCGLVWLGLQSFERQRQALASLTAEKLSSAIEARIRTEAQTAFTHPTHPIIQYSFTMEHGVLTQPAIYASPPSPTPREFLDAEHLELDLNRPDQALEIYRTASGHAALAASRVARCLAKLGRTEEAKAAWREIASSYPDERDLSHRPYGIIAALEAGDIGGLYDRIASGRWDLSGDQAQYFLATIDATRSTPYLDRFRFAGELQASFHPPANLHEGNVYSYNCCGHRIFYRAENESRVTGFAVNDGWVTQTLRPQVARELGMNGNTRQDLQVYGAAVALVLVMLSTGVILLLRDVAREARTNRVRADLVSSVSHDLKTPITLIRLYGETLLRKPELAAQQKIESYGIIVRESERLSRLVDRVLTFARIERGALKYTFEQGDLAPVLSDIVDDSRDYLDRAGFRLHRNIATAVPDVRYDAAAVSQAVVNLLDNAMKYSGESRDIAVRLSAQHGSVAIDVEDHGIGIAPAEQAHVFDRFYRAPNGSGKGGYGLGLFLIRHIMEAHGGRVELESEQGRGSRFRLIFPVVET